MTKMYTEGQEMKIFIFDGFCFAYLSKKFSLAFVQYFVLPGGK
jgi:hypothetical protein